MERLCERPGCSERASVAYGMRAEDLVFWLDRLTDFGASEGGVLCQRHADTMVVPRGWTLDDLRDPDLHLFRPPAAVENRRPRSRRSTGNSTGEHDTGDIEQLALGVETPDEPSATVTAADDADSVVVPVAESGEQESWTPNFDTNDDLDGLLSARSPLLARAFRGDDRPRGTPGPA